MKKIILGFLVIFCLFSCDAFDGSIQDNKVKIETLEKEVQFLGDKRRKLENMIYDLESNISTLEGRVDYLQSEMDI